MTKSTFVTVQKYADLGSAQVAKGMLESEGVFAHIVEENFAGITAYPTAMMGGIQLQVHESDLETAQDLLQIGSILQFKK